MDHFLIQNGIPLGFIQGLRFGGKVDPDLWLMNTPVMVPIKFENEIHLEQELKEAVRVRSSCPEACRFGDDYF